MLISSNGLKRKSSSSITKNNNSMTQMIPSKRFRATDCDGNIDSMSTTLKTIANHHPSPSMMSEYRQLQYELQCQEALLVLMQKLKTNQRLISQTKQRTTTTTVNATKLNTPVPPTKPSTISTNRSGVPTTTTTTTTGTTSVKPPHPNQYTVNRSNPNSQSQSSKISQSLPQATRQTNNNSPLPTTATRLSSTVPSTATKTSSSSPSTTTTPISSKNNGLNNDQHLLSAKLALRKQLEQTLLQIPTPKPTTCDLPYIPGINGWAEFLTLIGLEQAFNTYTDFLHRRLTPDLSINLPNVCAQCNTDWSVTWHEVISTNENEIEEKILCDRCRKTSQKKILKQDHSNRLRQAFMKALQQEKELDAKFQQQTPSTTTTTIKQSSSSSSSSHSKHSSKPVSTKLNSNHQSSKHSNHHHHHHSNKSSKSQSSTSIPSAALPPTLPSSLNPADAFASTLAALPMNEQIELFQKHFLSNMFPLAFANQAVALASKSTQQQQQALAASFPAMAASLMRQGNPAQYLLDMIPQAAKQQQQQQQQHHHRHSK